MYIPEVCFNRDKTNQAEFEIISLESIYQRGHHQIDPEKAHRLGFFNLVYISEGGGTHQVDFEEYAFGPGDFIFIQLDQVHAYDFSNQPKGFVLLFTQAFLDQVHSNMRLPSYTPTHLNKQHSPIVSLDNETQQRCQRLITEIQLETALEDKDPLIVMYLFSSLSLILHRLRPELRHDKLSEEQSRKFERFFELLQAQFTKTRDAAWYADQIHTTYKTLNAACKRATNQTAKQLIDAYTILEAKRRLAISQISIQQLSYDLGFEDASNFVKYFKKRCEMTPSVFQKKISAPKL